jgi:hypothetical protein
VTLSTLRETVEHAPGGTIRPHGRVSTRCKTCTADILWTAGRSLWPRPGTSVPDFTAQPHHPLALTTWRSKKLCGKGSGDASECRRPGSGPYRKRATRRRPLAEDFESQ